jgi:hypothetical protein
LREVDFRGVGGCAAAFFDVVLLGGGLPVDDLPVDDLPVADLPGVALLGAGLRAPVLRPEPL